MTYFTTAKYIQEIAETRNISAAAEQLGISQPALSAQLRKLEGQLGAVLFDRSKQPLEITEAGKVYLQYALKYEALHNEFQQHIADIGDLKQGSLTIGGAGSFNVSYLPETMAEFMRRYPGIDVKIIDGNIPDITTKAVNGQVDLFISPPWKQDDRLQYEKILEENVFLCVPPQWEINESLWQWRISPNMQEIKTDGRELCTFPQVDFCKFKDLPFVLLKEEQHIRHMMERLFKKYQFRPDKITLAEQTMTSYNLTLAGVGISLMTESTIRNSNFKEHPVLYMPDAEICRRTMYAAYSKNKYLSKAADIFIQILREKLQSGAV